MYGAKMHIGENSREAKVRCFSVYSDYNCFKAFFTELWPSPCGRWARKSRSEHTSWAGGLRGDPDGPRRFQKVLLAKWNPAHV